MASSKKPRFLPRLLAGTGYLICLLQWLWIILLVLPALMDSGLLTSFTAPRVEPQIETHSNANTSPLLLITGGIVTILMVVVTIVILLKFPSNIARTGSTITHKTADLIVPVVSHHKPMNAKRRRTLTARVIFYVKLALVVIPLITCFFVPVTHTITRELVVFIGAVLAIASLSLFCLEYVTIFAQSRRASR